MSAWSKPIISKNVSVLANSCRADAILIAASAVTATLGISGLPLAAATDQIPVYLLGLITAYIGGFIATWLIGFDDPPEEK